MPGDITGILQNWDSNNEASIQQLTPLVYAELHKIAESYMRRARRDHTLQATALINEAYVRLVRQERATFRDRGHFYGLAAKIMRGILIDFARARASAKRGSGLKVQLDRDIDISQQGAADLLSLHDALASFANFQDEGLGDPAAAAKTLTKAASIIEGVLQRSRTLDALEAAQAVQGGLTSVRDIGRLTEAMQAVDNQQSLLGELLKLNPSSPQFKRALTLSFQVKSVIYYDDFSPSLMDPVHGAREAERFLANARESVSSDPKNSAARLSTAIAQSRLAACLRFVRPGDALGHARAALAALAELHRQHPAYLTETRLPRLKRILAESLIEKGLYHQAVTLSEETIADNKVLIVKYPGEYAVIFNLITALYTAGNANHKAGNLDAAREHLKSAFELADSQFSKRTTSLEFANMVRKMAEARASCAASPSEKDHWSSLAANAWQRYIGGPNEFVDRYRIPNSSLTMARNQLARMQANQ